MKAENFINLINNRDYYSLHKIPDGDVQLVKDKLDYTEKTFKYFDRDIVYAVCTNLYECEDGFVMVSGVCYIEEDTYTLPKDIGVKCKAILCKFPEGTNFDEAFANRQRATDSIRRWLPKDCEVKEMNIADGGSVKNKMLERPESEPKHPDYYKGANDGGRSIEVFDIIDQFVNGDFYLGNVLKYVCRAGKKSKETKRQDLEKALHYIKEAIKRV